MALIPSSRPTDCNACGLRTGCKQIVQSVLPQDAVIVLIGEAPGAEEDNLGRPFHGPAGRLLDSILTSLHVSRSEVGIANILGCRPPDNRKPTAKEANLCWKYVEQELKQLPNLKVIVPLGDTALNKVIPKMGKITQIHGHVFTSPDYTNCQIIPAYHPAYVLRNEVELRSAFIADLRKAVTIAYNPETLPVAAPTDYQVVETKEQFDWVIDQLHSNDLWACDLETTGFNVFKDTAFIIGFSWQEFTAVVLDVRKLFFIENSQYVHQRLEEVFANESKKIFHNGPFDIQFLMTMGFTVQNYYADTILMHHLLEENSRHGLEILAAEYTDKGGYDLPLAQYRQQNKIDNYADIPPEIIYPYAAADNDVTLRSYNAMMPQIYEQQLDYVLFNISMPAQTMLIMTEYFGVQIDVPRLDKTIEKYARNIEEQLAIIQQTPQVVSYEKDKTLVLVQELFEKYRRSTIAKKRFPSFELFKASRKEGDYQFTFNPNSHLQLKELLIDRMKLPVVKCTKKGRVLTKNPSLDAEVLEIYAKKHKHMFCIALSKASSLAHLKGTFLDGIKERLDENGRVHTDFLLFGARTGRPSSQNPNLNNIPSNNTAKDIKDIFCADTGNNWMVEVDRSQAEFRVGIHYSKDPQAIYDLDMGIDIHKLGAAVCKGARVPRGNLTWELYCDLVKDVTKEERSDAKFTIFGTLYGRGPKSIAEQYGISVMQAQVIQNWFFGRYPKVKIWLHSQITHARMHGYVVSMFGRRRRLPDIHSKDTAKVSNAENQAQNAPIQSAASDLTLMAGIDVMRWIWENGYQSRLILTVYDSLAFTVPDNELEVVAKRLWEEILKPPAGFNFTVKLAAEMKIGKNWGSLLEVNPVAGEWGLVYNKLQQHVQSVRDKEELSLV